jgi:hypothetical protein
MRCGRGSMGRQKWRRSGRPYRFGNFEESRGFSVEARPGSAPNASKPRSGSTRLHDFLAILSLVRCEHISAKVVPDCWQEPNNFFSPYYSSRDTQRNHRWHRFSQRRDEALTSKQAHLWKSVKPVVHSFLRSLGSGRSQGCGLSSPGELRESDLKTTAAAWRMGSPLLPDIW